METVEKKFSSIIENYDVLASFWWVCDLHTSFGSIIMYKLKMEIFRQIRDVCQIFGYVPLCVDTKPTKMVFFHNLTGIFPFLICT